jgi:hypothetical protein
LGIGVKEKDEWVEDGMKSLFRVVGKGIIISKYTCSD